MEICLIAGRPLSEVHQAGREPLQGYRPIKIGLDPPREALRERIANRVHRMIEQGWLAEVSALMRGGTPPSAKAFDFIGYRELRGHLEGRTSLPEATQAIIVATRQYAKRQMTWFRKEPGVTWISGFGDDPTVVGTVLKRLAENLPGPPREAMGRGEISDQV